MKKFLTTIHGWWLRTFRNYVVQKIEFDAYKVVFRRFTMDIETKSGNMKLRTELMQYPQSFLLHCVSQGDTKTLEWFCNEVYQFVALITTDQGLVNDVQKAFAKFYKRMEKKAESIAKEVSEDDKQIASEIVKSNIEYGKMSKKERKAHKEAIKEVLTKTDE